MPSFGWRNVEHGDQCACMLLARAVGASPSCIDFAYCRDVLQKHWRVTCNHGGAARPAKVTPRLPALDATELLEAAVLANAPAA